MTTKTGSSKIIYKRSKKIKGGDYELLERTIVYKVWYEYLQEIRTCENIMNLDLKNHDRQRISWNKTVNFQKADSLQKLQMRFSVYGHKWERLLGTKKKSRKFWRQYDAWAIGNEDIETTLDTFSSDQWKKRIFGTEKKKGNAWKKLFGIKKTVAASKVSPGDVRHAKSSKQSVSRDEVLIKINLAENTREEIDKAIQEILSGELKKLDRGRGKNIKKKNDAQFQVNGLVNTQSLKRRLDIAIEERDGKMDVDDLNARFKTKGKRYVELYAHHSLKTVRLRVQKMVQRDRSAYRKTMNSVIEGRFDVTQ